MVSHMEQLLTPLHVAPTQLDRIKTGFPPEVAKAILIELKKKVDASTEILDRDKQYFVQQIKAILGFDL
jgi:hypothetical protein